MLRAVRPVAWGLLPCLSACASYEVADLRPLLAHSAFPLTQGEPPVGTETVGIVAAQDSGFYLFGFIPIVSMHMETCVDRIVREAKALGGEGVASIEIRYDPATFLKMCGLFLPDWFGYVSLTGSAWRRKQ